MPICTAKYAKMKYYVWNSTLQKAVFRYWKRSKRLKMPKRSFFRTKIVKHNKCCVANMRLLTKQTTSAARGTFYHCREAHGNWQQKFRYTATDTRDGTGQNCFCNCQYKLALSQINFKSTLPCCNSHKRTKHLKHNNGKHNKLVGEKRQKTQQQMNIKSTFCNTPAQ